jgi:hypothetical protein
MLTKRQEAVASTTAPRQQEYQKQSYNKVERLSSLLPSPRKKSRLRQIQEVLAKILFALESQTITDCDRKTLLFYLDRLLRLFVEVKYGL